jgi:hypothetical protein
MSRVINYLAFASGACIGLLTGYNLYLYVMFFISSVLVDDANQLLISQVPAILITLILLSLLYSQRQRYQTLYQSSMNAQRRPGVKSIITAICIAFLVGIVISFSSWSLIYMIQTVIFRIAYY